MKQNIKKISTVLCSMTLLAGVVGGCGSNNNKNVSTNPSPAGNTSKSTSPTNTAGDKKAPDKLIEISAMVFDRSNAPEGEGTVTDNRWTKWINEEMAKQGIKVNFIPIPRSEESTKIPVMVASQTAADLMMTYTYPTVKQFYDNGGLYELSSYLDQYGPNLKTYIGEDAMNVGRNENGELYAITARRSTTAASNVLIRKDWLDTLGMGIPTTVDELYQALKGFKEQDPGKMGKDKVIPFSGGMIIEKAFMNIKDDKSYLVTSVVDPVGWVLTDPGFRDYMKWRNKLYNEGLMDKEYFTSKNFSQKEKEFAVSGALGYWEYDVNGNVDTLRGGILQNLKQNIPEAELVSMLPVKNVNDGKVYNRSYPVSGAMVFIPKTAKNPEACIQYLDFLADYGGFAVFHGVEGEHFTYVDGVPVVKDAEYNAKTKDWTRHDLFLVGNQGYYKTEQDFIAATAKELPEWEKYVIDNYTNAIQGVRLPSSTYVSPIQTEENANLQKIWDDYTVKITTANPADVDKLYDEAIKELKKYKAEEIIAERQAYYDKMMK